jgi:hypothetical protein
MLGSSSVSPFVMAAVAAGCQESIAAADFTRVKRGMSRRRNISLSLTYL